MKLNKFADSAIIGTALTTSAQAQNLLLTVNVSNPSAIIFTTIDEADVSFGLSRAYLHCLGFLKIASEFVSK